MFCTGCSIIGDAAASNSIASSGSNDSVKLMNNPAYIPIGSADGLSAIDLMSRLPPQTRHFSRPLPPLDLPQSEDMHVHVEHSTMSSIQETTVTGCPRHFSQRPRAFERGGTPELESIML